MPKTDFYNSNKYRSYPLKDYSSITINSIPLSDEAILDASFIIGVEEPVDSQYRVYLTSINKRTGYLDFTFTPEGSTEVFVFECDITDEEGSTQSDDTTTGGGGFIVTGDLTELYASLSSGVNAADDTYIVEQALVQYLANTFITGINLASEEDDYSDGGDRWQFATTATGITGSPVFTPGYNATIVMSPRKNYIEIGARIGAGEGEPCGRIVLDSESIPPTDACADSIATINGLPPTSQGVFKIVGSPGIEVENQPDNHKIIIKFKEGYDIPFCIGD